MADSSTTHVDDLLTQVREMLTRGETSTAVAETIDAALDEARRINAPESIAKALLFKANHAMIAGEYATAVALCEEGLEIVRGTGMHIEADLLVMASRQLLANDVPRALALTTEAMSVSAAATGTAHPNIMIRHAQAVGASGDLDGAIALLRQADALYEIEEDAHGRVTALGPLCVQLINAQRFAEVVEYATEAIALADEMGRSMAKINAFKFLAMALGRSGHLSEAFEVGQKALDLAKREFPGTIVGDCNGVLGDVYQGLNDLRSALVCYSRALRIYRETGHQNGVAMCLLHMGETYARAEEVAQAERLLEKAEQLARDSGNEIIVRRTLYARAGLFVRAGDRSQAERMLEETSDDLSHLEQQHPERERVDAALQAFRSIADSTVRERLPDPDEIDLDTDTPVPVVDTAESFEHEAGIHVTMLGSFSVRRAGTEITMDEWKRKKARDVFKVLASRHRRSVTVEEIVQYLWGADMDPERCLPTLQNAISAIRSALEPDLKPRQPSSYLQFRDGSYLLDLGPDAQIDSDSFLKSATDALACEEPRERLRLLQGASAAYAGEFLPDDRFEDWTDHPRGTLQDLAAEVHHALAALYFEQGNDAAARQALQRAVELEDDGE